MQDIQVKILTETPSKETLSEFIELLNKGEIRIVTKQEDKYIVNEWVKTGILKYLKHSDFKFIQSEISNFYDKTYTRFLNTPDSYFKENSIRVLPQGYIRNGVHIAKNCIIMPSIINIGAYIDSGTMIDMGAAIGSCAQIGKNCHISANSTIGGVLEPVNASPCIIEDNVFIGANSCVVEGAVVREGAVISNGVHISKSTKIVNRETKEITFGEIPKNAVVIPGSYSTTENLSISCAVIAKYKDEKTSEKVSINEFLRTL